jgi:hypothetical protein
VRSGRSPGKAERKEVSGPHVMKLSVKTRKRREFSEMEYLIATSRLDKVGSGDAGSWTRGVA